jgi:hypothetical protein
MRFLPLEILENHDLLALDILNIRKGLNEYKLTNNTDRSERRDSEA